MSLNTPSLANAIQTAILSISVGNNQTLNDIITPEQKQAIYDSWYLIAGAIVTHITQNALVTVTMQSHTHTGVTTGVGTSGPPVPTSETGTVS